MFGCKGQQIYCPHILWCLHHSASWPWNWADVEMSPARMPPGPGVGGEQVRHGPHPEGAHRLGKEPGPDQGPAPATVAAPWLTHARMKPPGGPRVGSLPGVDLWRARVLSCLSARVRLFPPAPRLGWPSCFPWLVPSHLIT